MTRNAFRSAVAILGLFAPAAFAAQTLLVLASPPGDYIGQGQFRVITTSDADFRVLRTFDNGIRVELDDFSRPNPRYTFWYVTFAAPSRAAPAVGAYEGATRWPFQLAGVPGLDVSGDGRGCNQLFGRFDIREVEYGPNGTVIRFAADFEQHCESPSTPTLVGGIRFNSDVPISLQVPPVIRVITPLNYQGCAEATGPGGASVSLTVEQQATPGDFAFDWTTSTGLAGSGPNFSVQVGLDAPVTVTVTQTNLSTSETISVSKSICSSDTTPPLVEILKPVSGERLATGNILLEVRVTDIVDKAIPNYTAFVGNQTTIPLKNGFSRTRLSRAKTVGGGIETFVQVQAQDAHGNVSDAYVNVTIAPGPNK